MTEDGIGYIHISSFTGNTAKQFSQAREDLEEQKMKALIKTFMMRGGFEIQINVLDRDTLLAAQKNPEQYQDLVVRIGGYSDYFVKISPNMQAEVLLRTEHEM